MKRVLVLLCVILVSWSSAPKSQLAKQVYFAPYDTVTINGEQRFRARCFGMSGAHAIDLRPDASSGVGVALCVSDALPASMAGVLSITNALDGAVSPVVKGLIRAAIGAANVNELTATTFDQLVFQLLIDLPKAKGGLWKPLQPGKDGKYHIHLGQEFQQTTWLYPIIMDGGLVADAQKILLESIEPTVAWAASFSESWNVADNSTLNGDLTWTRFSGTGCGVVSNQGACSGIQSATFRAEVDTATTDMDVSATLVTLTKGNGPTASFDVIARKDSSAAGTYYSCQAVDDTNPQHILYKRVIGIRTDLASDPTDPTNGETWDILAVGSSMSCLRNSATLIGPSTDTSITLGTRGGVRYNGDGSTSSVTFDNWSISDSGAPFGPLRRRAM